jgi:hypothetical protein
LTVFLSNDAKAQKNGAHRSVYWV